MTNKNINLGYQITTDGSFQKKRMGITPIISSLLDKLGIEITHEKPNSALIQKIQEAIKLYPHVPIFKNYLNIAYQALGLHDKADEIIELVLKEHPDYLFGKLNKAEKLINEKQYDRACEILGEQLEIKFLYPERDVFHTSEVVAFYKTVIKYLVAIENLELAENRLEILEAIAPPKDKSIETYATLVSTLRITKGLEWWSESLKDSISVQSEKFVPKTSKSDPPSFNIEIIDSLYKFDIDIPHDILKEILEAPRELVIKDLEAVLQDAVDRYGYFTTADVDAYGTTFALHAIFLLRELKAEESLPKILSILEYDDKFLYFWFGDLLSESLWMYFFDHALTQLDTYKAFLLKEGVGTYSKLIIATALSQAVLYYPKKRLEVMPIFDEVLTAFLNTDKTSNLFDTDLTAFLISDAQEADLVELLPLIEKLFEKKYVAISVCGSFDRIKTNFKNKDKHNYKKEIRNIFEYYDYCLESLTNFDEDDDEDIEMELLEDEEDDYYSDYEEVKAKPITVVNIGRNDPCPCGSGKKYKKCCIDKI